MTATTSDASAARAPTASAEPRRLVAALGAWLCGMAVIEALLIVLPVTSEALATGALGWRIGAFMGALYVAALVRFAEGVRPILWAVGAKARGEALSPAIADAAQRAFCRAPLATALVRLALYVCFVLGVLIHAYVRGGAGHGMTLVARGGLALMRGVGLAALGCLLEERILDGVRSWALPNLDRLRLFANVYRGRIVRIAMVGAGLAAVMPLFAVEPSAGSAFSARFVFGLGAWPVLAPAAFLGWRSLRRRTAAVEVYFDATVRQPGTRGPARDEPRAVTAFLAAQALPYRLALYQATSLALAFVVSVAVGRVWLGFDARTAGRLLVVDGLAVLGASVFQLLATRGTLRPLLRHLGSRHHLPLGEIRSRVSLAAKLGAMFAVVAIAAPALWEAARWMIESSANVGLLAWGPSLAGLAVLIALVTLFVRQTLDPIAALEGRSEEMARGELARPVPPAGEADEIGRLTVAFEGMRRSLRDKLRSTESINIDLEREVRRRTDALEQRNIDLRLALDKLQKAQESLLRSEKLASMGRLVAGIAHEINNPVNAVINSLGPLEDAVTALAGGRDGEAAEMLAVVRRGAERTKAIVQALHNYSRGDDSTPREVSLATSVDDSLDLLRHRLRDVRVTKTIDPDARIQGFPGQIDQVLVNLIANAAQAIGGAGGTITVGARAEGDHVIVTVADDGPGIPADVLPRIFDPFFTTKDVGEGSGLGLSIVHGIIERHGGTIDVDTAVGRGSTFRMRLPRARARDTVRAR